MNRYFYIYDILLKSLPVRLKYSNDTDREWLHGAGPGADFLLLFFNSRTVGDCSKTIWATAFPTENRMWSLTFILVDTSLAGAYCEAFALYPHQAQFTLPGWRLAKLPFTALRSYPTGRTSQLYVMFNVRSPGILPSSDPAYSIQSLHVLLVFPRRSSQ